MPTRVYKMEHLGCANCAAKIEEKVSRLPGVEDVSLTFATRQLRLTAEDPDALLPEVRRIANSYEPEIRICSRQGEGAEHRHEHHHHDHGEACACGQEQHHHELDDCGCGHGHHRHHASGDGAHEQPPAHHGTVMPAGTAVFHLEHLGCANCAAKMEKSIRELPGVTFASITFATQKLHLAADDPAALLQEIRTVCSAIEPEVQVIPLTERPAVERENKKKDLFPILCGMVLFLIGVVLEHADVHILGVSAALPVLVAAYAVLGARVVMAAARTLLRGQVFDENFLMSAATLGAFVIHEYPEAVGVMLFYRIGQYFEHRAVERSRSQIMAAADLRPEVVSRVSGGDVSVIPAAEACPGDLLLVRPGDRIPLDGVVAEGESRIDTAPVTGEPVPVRVVPGDAVISGCINTSGRLYMRVEKPLEDSVVTRIIRSVESAAASKPKIDRFITRFARIYTPVVVALAAATATVPPLFLGDWQYWIYTALSFLVMSCPCALVLSIPLAFFSGIGAGSREGILFKGGVTIEAISRVRAVVMDKTGTVTCGSFTLQAAEACAGYTELQLLALCAGCEQRSSHPIAQSIVAAAKERGLQPEEPEELEELAGYGIRARLNGREILCGSGKLMARFGVSVGKQEAAAGAQVLVAADGQYVGKITIADSIKSDAAEAVEQLHRQGLVTAMLTGDTEAGARAVAEMLAIDEFHARLLPQEKLERLQEIRKRYGAVMFVGDGINDAPVLAGADVGGAMGSGADAAIEAADVVFMTSAVSAVPKAVSIARRTGRIARQNVVFALGVKALVMLLGLLGCASMWMAVFADSGVAMLCVLNSIRILYQKNI